MRIWDSVFKNGYFGEATQVPFDLAVIGGKKCLHQIPGQCGANDATAETQDVHVVVLDTLPCGKMIFDQAGAYAFDFISTYCRAHSAAANGNASFHLARGDGPRQRCDEIGEIILGHQEMCAKIHDLVTSLFEAGQYIMLQSKTAVISCNSNAHTFVLFK